MEECNCYILCL